MLKNVRLGIYKVILIGYILVLITALATDIFTYFVLRHNNKLDNTLTDDYIPYHINLKELNTMIASSVKLTKNWIYQPNGLEKQELEAIINRQYPELRHDFGTNHADKLIAKYLKDHLSQADHILKIEQLIISKLNHNVAYTNPLVVQECIRLLEDEIIPTQHIMNKEVGEQIVVVDGLIRMTTKEKKSSYTMLNIVMFLTVTVVAIVALFAFFLSMNKIVKPIHALKEIILKLSKGEIPEIIIPEGNDEIGQMSGAIKTMLHREKLNTEFALQIGKGNYNSSFVSLSKEDKMGNALLDMRVNLLQNTLQENQRSWANQGQAQLGELLRQPFANASEFYNAVLKFVVKYLGANQGGLFVYNEADALLSMEACYAYDRQKYLHQTIAIGEGLVGQCYLEKESIYMTDVPESYVSITSGLGLATPKCILIVPLKVNETIHGILELATFSPFEPYQVEFVERIAEGIASSIQNTRVNDHTKQLLADSQFQREQLRSQEEEIRQNMEELQATHDEQQRKEENYLARIRELETQLLLQQVEHL